MVKHKIQQKYNDGNQSKLLNSYDFNRHTHYCNLSYCTLIYYVKQLNFNQTFGIFNI